MAKGNLILGTATRSLGDVVLYRRDGQQVSRARVRNIKNPRSDAQLCNRVVTNTIAQAYSRLKEICDHSFEGHTVGVRNMQRFLKINNSVLRAQLRVLGEDWSEASSFAPLGTRWLAPNTYVISEGTLRAIPAGAITFTDEQGTFNFALPENTYKSVLDTYGLQRGDQLTFVHIMGNYADIETVGQLADMSDIHMAYTRIILDPRNADGSAADITVPFIGENGINLPSPLNSGNSFFNIQYPSTEGATGFTMTVGGWDFLASGVIVSHKAGETWQYSTCKLQLSREINGAEMGRAIYASQKGGVDVASKYYLQQAKN